MPHLELNLVWVAKHDQRSANLVLDAGMRDTELVEMTCPRVERLAIGAIAVLAAGVVAFVAIDRGTPTTLGGRSRRVV